MASVDKKRCVACGVCENTCPLAAVKVYHGCYAVVEETVCVGCGKCAKNCPAGAITKGDELNTNAEKCIKCCACVKACANKARKYDTPFASLLSECFKKQKLPQTIL